MTVGATLLTVTVWVAVLLSALSESLTCTDTIELAGPSGKRADEAARAGRRVNVAVPTWLPLAPQLTETRLKCPCPDR